MGKSRRPASASRHRHTSRNAARLRRLRPELPDTRRHRSWNTASRTSSCQPGHFLGEPFPPPEFVEPGHQGVAHRRQMTDVFQGVFDLPRGQRAAAQSVRVSALPDCLSRSLANSVP